MARAMMKTTESTERGLAPGRGVKAWLFALMALAAVGMGGYAIVAYTTRPLGSLVHPEMRAAFEAYRPAILLHVFGSSVATILGPLQFVGSLRRRWPRGHRVLGRLYLTAGVLCGGGAGLFMAAHAFGGPVSKVGFAMLAVAWLYTGWRAYAAARGRRFDEHRRWMVRNFALTLSAVTLRAGLGLGLASGLSFEAVYPALAWACWLPNLAVAEWLARRPRGPGAGR